MLDLSIVLPAFNEADNIERSVRSCAEVSSRLGLQYEIIVVDDGSHDATVAVLEELKSEIQGTLRCIQHPRNRGYGAALKSGLLAATGKKVFFTDADLQFDVRDLSSLLLRAAEVDIVAGYRAPRQDPPIRVLNGWAWSRLMRALFDLDVRDVDCAFKVFDQSVLRELPIHSIGAFVNTEILVRAKAAGRTMCQVPVAHYPRSAGQASGANIRVIARAFRELSLLYGELKELERAPQPSRAEGLPPNVQ